MTKASTQPEIPSGTLSESPWPVLAQIPHVSMTSDQATPELDSHDSRPRYRFDSAMHNDVGEMAKERKPHAHVIGSAETFGPAPRDEQGREERSRLFPDLSDDGDRFSESLKPLIRIAVVIALLSIAGLSLALIQDFGQLPLKTPKTSPPSTDRPVISALQKQSPIDIPKESNFTDALAPTAKGPLGSHVGLPVYPETKYPQVKLAIDPPSLIPNDDPLQGQKLPKVRNTERTPAIAKLPGYILEPSTRQAKHDTHESSVH